MKAPLLIIQLILLSFACLAQVNFENGYFIDENGKKTDCLIKNSDWKNNPTQFKYKLTKDSSIKEGSIGSVKEFGINNEAKYIKAIVNIDRSSDELEKLSTQLDPEFEETALFLKVLIEGEANLYVYESKGFRRFFYAVNSSPIEQLVYKRYILSDESLRRLNKDGRKTPQIRENNRFRQQLKLALQCNSIKEKQLSITKYVKPQLLRLFIKYNQCKNAGFINYAATQRTKDVFNISIRPGINLSRVIMKNTVIIDPVKGYADVTSLFSNKINLRFGIDAEYILPFNKNKWSIIVEPTYQSYKDSANFTMFNRTVNYRSLDVPLGLRHFFYLNKDFTLFINAGYVLSFGFNSIITQNLEIGNTDNAFAGLGLKYKKYGIELRYHTPRELLPNYFSQSATYKTISFVLGYQLF